MEATESTVPTIASHLRTVLPSKDTPEILVSMDAGSGIKRKVGSMQFAHRLTVGD
jgi:hypothetical protein